MTSQLFSHPAFQAAVDDIEALGVKIGPDETSGARRYAVLGGRSNSRWWLIPLENRHVAASSLAMFQPLLTNARYMKTAVALACRLGLGSRMPWKTVFLSGESSLQSHFPNLTRPVYAYFTGTDSPHRKAAVQIMDIEGNIEGYAKLTKSPDVGLLLKHEAKMLAYVRDLDLQTAYIPRLLFTGRRQDAELLVTDTLKTQHTITVAEFQTIHADFLQEIADKTFPSETLTARRVAEDLRVRLLAVQHRIDPKWARRLLNATDAIASAADTPIRSGLAHGDFTPWNTFITKKKVYVFDWEYAVANSPLSNDVIHFSVNELGIRSLKPSARLEEIMSRLSQPWIGAKPEIRSSLVLAYLTAQTLRQVERLESDPVNLHSDWDGAFETSVLLDHLLLGRSTIQ